MAANPGELINIEKTPRYDLAQVKKSVQAHFEALHIQDKLHADTHIVIKPNLIMKMAPEQAGTTHPVVLEAVILQLKECGARHITVAESPGGTYNQQQLKAIYAGCGVDRVCASTGAKLNLDTSSRVAPLHNAKLLKSMDIITPVLEADYIISLAKLKTHGMMSMSGAVKNMFGCVPGLLKPELHYRYPEREDFANMIVDICQGVGVHLAIIDAVDAMEGNGPTGGNPRHVGLTLASENPYELDLALAWLIGFSEQSVPTVQVSIARGLCSSSFEDLNIAGGCDAFEAIGDFKKPAGSSLDFTTRLPAAWREPGRKIVQAILLPKPVILKKICIGCGRCAQSCPAKTIKILEKKAKIEYAKCIKCYCCHELCPVRAIDLRRKFFVKL